MSQENECYEVLLDRHINWCGLHCEGV